ncbi:MAG: metallophosphoesterase [Clostridia bacterium]|nr:metallophosphoesterase [Clostridia bacterium]
MKKHVIFAFSLLVLVMLFSMSVFAATSNVEADELGDIVTAIAQASEGDTVNITLTGDVTIENGSSITVAKAITVNINFNGYQIDYKGTAGKSTTTAAIAVAKVGAVVNLKGNNPLADYKSYNHYGEDVKADMTGTGNLISVTYGEVNIEDAYLYANGAFVLYTEICENAEQRASVKGSVLRVPEGADYSAICYRGGNKMNESLVERRLTIEDTVEYGGFYGADYNFNLTIGSTFKNVKFYDFNIKNDCWYNPRSATIRPKLMVNYEEALLISGCSFVTYAGELDTIRIYTETAKQNIKLYNCEYKGLEKAIFDGKSNFSGDQAGSARVYVVEQMETCIEEGKMYYYNNGLGESNKVTNQTVVAKGEHTAGSIKAVYKNGYAQSGVGESICVKCGEAFATGDVFAPMIENLGYSVNQMGGSLAMGIKLNYELLEKTGLTENEHFDFGVFVGQAGAQMEVTNNVPYATKGFTVSLKEYGTQFFDIKVIGFNDELKDTGFVAEFYIYDGNEVTFAKENYREITEITYNGVLDLLDVVKQRVNALLESKHKLYYNEDGSFRVMVLADLHVRSSSDTTELENRIKRFVDEENPNLVIFTGDNTIGASNEEALRTCLDKMVGYIEEKQIPWCHVYGNHDREGALSNEKQQAVYESYEYCISKDVDGVSGVGNYVHGIYNRDGSLGSVIYFLDSGTSNGTYSYDYIQADQITWYESTSMLLQEYNGDKAVKGMMAFHIPLIENQYAYNNRDNKDVVYEALGDRVEPICSSTYDTNLFETILARKDVQAIVTGHDHNNTYNYNYYGVKLVSAPTISSLGYTNSDSHEGVRVFDLNLETIDDIETYINYVVKRVDADRYEEYGKDITIEDFEGAAPSTGVASLGGGGISGSITLEVVEGKGVNGSKAIEIKRSQTSNSEFYIYLSEENYGKVGENKYLVVWMDFTNVEFRKASTGLLSNNGNLPFMTDHCDGAYPPFYYLADGATEWEAFNHGGDGCFGASDGKAVKGMKGYFAFRIEDYLGSEKGAPMTGGNLVTGFYMYLDIQSGSYANQPFYIDNIMLVEDYNDIIG